MAKSKMISLEYCFIFARDANIWTKVYEFEKDLADFFGANKLQAEIISPIEGSGGRGVMFIEKIDTEGKLTNTKGINLQQINPSLGKAQRSSNIIRSMTNKVNSSYNKGGKK